MSEYQYYEFLAIDRPLTKEQMAELRRLSTRATITPTRFQNVYNWGNFRGDPGALMERYFDAFVYVASWGTRDLMLCFPRQLLGPKTTSEYRSCDAMDVQVTDDFVIMQFHAEDEERGGWEEGEGWMESLVPVREGLASGDLRALYFGWLLCAQSGFLEDDQVEPPVPPGLGILPDPLQALVEFLWIDKDLIAVAAERSAPLRDHQPSSREIQRWVVGLPQSEKDSLLLRLVGGETNLGAEMLQRYRRSAGSSMETAPMEGNRTVADLLAAAEERAERRRIEGQRREAEARARLERERAAARARYLDGLVGREAALWRQVEALVEKKQAREYDQAGQLVKDLYDLASRTRQIEQFNVRLGQLRHGCFTRPSFLKRLDDADLRAA